VTPYLIFVRGMMFPGRHTISERTGTRRRPRECLQGLSMKGRDY